jgi:hypothetical protein
MGRMQRNKGARVERELVNAHKEMGFAAERAPHSGAVKGRLTQMDGEDLKVELAEQFVLTFEAKARKDDWKTIRQQIARTDGLILKPNNEPPLVVLKWDTWERLLRRFVCSASQPGSS